VCGDQFGQGQKNCTSHNGPKATRDGLTQNCRNIEQQNGRCDNTWRTTRFFTFRGHSLNCKCRLMIALPLSHSNCLIVQTDDDVPYEEEILRNPNTLRCWLRYIQHKKDAPKNQLFLVYERCLKQLPGSYKIWKKYLDLRRAQIKGLNSVQHAELFEAVNECYERSLVLLNKVRKIKGRILNRYIFGLC
jgi:hypothetical protein